jgi:hypothetical protein
MHHMYRRPLEQRPNIPRQLAAMMDQRRRWGNSKSGFFMVVFRLVHEDDLGLLRGQPYPDSKYTRKIPNVCSVANAGCSDRPAALNSAYQ